VAPTIGTVSTRNRILLERLGLRNRSFLLAVGSANKNKNIARLIEAYLRLDCKDVPLVLAGGANSNVFSGVAFDECEQLIRTGYLTDAELAALYGNALAFVFPSLYEGFGLPPLEAMHFGCPVICSRSASVPEVAGDAALYCNALDVDDIAACLRRIMEEDTLRRTLIEKGKNKLLDLLGRRLPNECSIWPRRYSERVFRAPITDNEAAFMRPAGPVMSMEKMASSTTGSPPTPAPSAFSSRC